MYEDENNLYHYSYRKGDEQNPNAPIDTKNYAEDPWDKNPGGNPKKKGGSGLSGKIVALALVCALVGGFIGAGVSGATTKVNKTSVQVSDREVAQVQTVKVDGKTQMSMSEVYASNVNSVVSINVSSTTNYFGQTVQTAASGTGFLITQDGYILTNHHVISGASTVKVTLYNGETYDATVIGSDEDYDIAVLKIDVTGATPVVLGDSSKVAIGESVAAVGNPLGELTFSMSEGIVSCVNRAINVDGTPFNMIQVDCSINPGNSGGPLFNSYGEVIGIVSAKYSSYSNTTVEGIGFAIPINDVVAMVEDIMTDGYVTDKAYMGFVPQNMTAQMAQQYRYDVTEGVFVCSVDPDSAAAKAGLKLGDVITKIDDTTISDMTDLNAAKKSYRAGDTVTLTIYREGKTIEVELTFDAAPETTETSSSDQSTDNSYNGNGGYGNGGNGYYSNPWDFFNSFFGNGYYGSSYSGESRDPEKVRELISGKINELKRDGVDEKDFERIRRKLYGRAVFDFNDIESIANEMVSATFNGETVFSGMEVLENLTKEDVEKRLLSSVDTENCVLSVIKSN